MKKALILTLLSTSAMAQLPADAPRLDNLVLDAPGVSITRTRGLTISRVPKFPATREECHQWENAANNWESNAIALGVLGGGGAAISAGLSLLMHRRKASIATGVISLAIGTVAAVSAFKADTYGDRYMDRCTADAVLNAAHSY